MGHRVHVLPGEVVQLGPGILASSPARTWLDKGNELGPVALVALGDQLIRCPRADFEGQIVLRTSDRFSFSADLGYRSIRVAIQYDGDHHLTDEQRRRDARRDAEFRAAGWVVVIVTAEDRHDDFARIRARLRSLFAARAAYPSVATGT